MSEILRAVNRDDKVMSRLMISTAGVGLVESGFRELGRAIDARWRDAHYDHETFPSLASRALSENNLTSELSLKQVLDWVWSTPDLPQQEDIEATFGDPPLTLYRNERFYISLLVWADSTTSIHEHGFGGAFQVLQGSSLHSRFAFTRRDRINDHLLVGDISSSGSEILHRGEVRSIEPGGKFIHSLFHLERPSATIVVRTHETPGRTPQFSYLRPSLAYDPFFVSKHHSLRRRLQCLTLAFRLQSPDLFDTIEQLVATEDTHSAFVVLDLVNRYLCNRMKTAGSAKDALAESWADVLTKARARHGDVIDMLPSVFERQVREATIVSRRETIVAPEHRFFLALLLNALDRRTILDVVQREFPDKTATETVVDWLEELSRSRDGTSAEETVLGVNIDDLSLLIVENALNEIPPSESAVALAKDGWLSAESSEERVKDVLATLRVSILGPLFNDAILGS